MARQPEDPNTSSLPFLVTLPAIFSCLPVDEDGGGDEGGDEEDDPRRLLLRRPRVRHVLEPVQRRLLFSERERGRKLRALVASLDGQEGNPHSLTVGREPKKRPMTEHPLLFLLAGNSHKLATNVE